MSPEIFTELIITIDEPPEDPEGEYTENLIPLAFHGMWGPPEDDKEIYIALANCWDRARNAISPPLYDSIQTSIENEFIKTISWAYLCERICIERQREDLKSNPTLNIRNHNICHPCHTYPIARKMWLHTIELCKTKLISR